MACGHDRLQADVGQSGVWHLLVARSLTQLFPKSLALVVRLGKSTLDAMNRTVSLCMGSALPKKYINRLVPRDHEEGDRANQRWLWVDMVNTKDWRGCGPKATDCLVKYVCTKYTAWVPSDPMQFGRDHTMRQHIPSFCVILCYFGIIPRVRPFPTSFEIRINSIKKHQITTQMEKQHKSHKITPRKTPQMKK